MIAAQVIEKNVLIATILAYEDPDAPGTFPFREAFLLDGSSPPQYKVFWEHVEGDVDLPYLVVSHMMGGRGQGTGISQSYSDTVWKIAVHTADMSSAENYASLVGALQDVCPVTTDYTGVSATNNLQEIMPVFDRYQVQNVPMFVIGGLYRLMLNLGAN